jgi:hypothetical protein
MASNPGRLEIIIAALDRATGPLRALGDRLRRFSQAAGIDRLRNAFSGVGKGIGNVVGELGRLLALGGAAAVGIGVLVNKATEAGDALGNAATRAGLSVDAYSELGFAAAKAGVEQDKFADSVDTFVKNLGEAKLGKGKLTAFLKDLSPTLLRTLKGSKGTEAALDVMFKALVRVKDPAKRAALAVKAFGSNGKLMAQLIAGGIDDIAEARKEYRLIAGSSQEFVDRAQEMDTQVDQLTATLTGMGRGVMTELFPAFIQIAKVFNRFLLDNRENIKAWAKQFGEKLMGFAQRLPQYIEQVGDSFDRMKQKLAPLADMVGGFGNLLAITAGLIVGGPLLAALASLATSFVVLGFAIATTPIGWFLAGIAAIAAAAFLIIKNWEPIKQFFSEMWQDIKGLFTGFTDFLLGVFTLDTKRAWEGIKRIFTSGGYLAKKGLQQIAFTNPLTAPFAIAASQMSGGSSKIGSQRPQIGAGTVLAAPAAPAQASVTVDFKNTPKGTLVTPARDNTAFLAIDVGYNIGLMP